MLYPAELWALKGGTAADVSASGIAQHYPGLWQLRQEPKSVDILRFSSHIFLDYRNRFA